MRIKPYTVLLFDEFEEALCDIACLLLQVLHEGFLSGAQGHTVDLCNIVIVLISNLSADVLLNGDSTHQDSFEVSPSTNEVVMTAVGSTSLPGFIKRLDKVIFFRRLSKSALTDVVDVRLNELKASLEDHRVVLRIDDDIEFGWQEMQMAQGMAPGL